MKRGSYPAAAAGCLALCGALLCGCGDASKEAAPAPTAGQRVEEKTAARTVLEGVTGKAAVDQGLMAREKLRALDAQRRKEMEALGP